MAEQNEYTNIQKYICADDTTVVYSSLSDMEAYILINPTHTEWLPVQSYTFSKINGTNV